MVSALLESSRGRRCPIPSITAINTLGNRLLVDNTSIIGPTIDPPDGAGVGGLGDPALHPLALGNVAILRRLLSKHEDLKAIDLIGVGGVSDTDGCNRMINVGASAEEWGPHWGLTVSRSFRRYVQRIYDWRTSGRLDQYGKAESLRKTRSNEEMLKRSGERTSQLVPI